MCVLPVPRLVTAHLLASWLPCAFVARRDLVCGPCSQQPSRADSLPVTLPGPRSGGGGGLLTQGPRGRTTLWLRESVGAPSCSLSAPSRLMTVAQHLAGRAATTVVTDALRSSGRMRPLHLPSPWSRSPCALTTALHSCPQFQPHPPGPRRENTDREEGLLLRPQMSAQSPP